MKATHIIKFNDYLSIINHYCETTSRRRSRSTNLKKLTKCKNDNNNNIYKWIVVNKEIITREEKACI